jgi:hypothetical protein
MHDNSSDDPAQLVTMREPNRRSILDGRWRRRDRDSIPAE